MISPGLRNRVQAVFEAFRSSGITESVTVIEQLSYLLFLKWHEAMEDGDLISNPSMVLDLVPRKYRWSALMKHQIASERFNYYREVTFPYWQGRSDQTIPNPFDCGEAVLLMPSQDAFDTAVDLVSAISMLNRADVPLMADVYREILERLGTVGHNQFMTPPLICDVMAELAAPKPQDHILDPVGGTAGLLLAADRVRTRERDGAVMTLEMKEFINAGNGLHAIELSPTMARLAAMNMLMHGLPRASVTVGNALGGTTDGSYDVILAHPPFGGTVDGRFRETIPGSSLRTADLNHLLLERFLGLVGTRGRCIVIVPDSLLTAGGVAATELRKRIVDDFGLEAVISLPPGAFSPFTGIKTSIVCIREHRTTDKVWFFDITDELQGPSASSSSLRLVPDLLRRVQGDEGDQSTSRIKLRNSGDTWSVPIEALAANGYMMAAEAYRPRASLRAESSPQDLVRQIRALGQKIDENMQSILDRLSEGNHD